MTSHPLLRQRWGLWYSYPTVVLAKAMGKKLFLSQGPRL